MLDNGWCVEPWEKIPDGLLTGLQRPTVERNELTYEYLEAGTRLITASITVPGAEQGDHPFLRWVSRSEIFEELRGSTLKVGEGTFRYRWKYHADYVRDLVAYVRWRRNESVLPLRSPEPIKDALGDSSPSTAIQRVVQMNLEGLFSNVYFPLQLVALAVAGAHSNDSQVVGDFYSETSRQWRSVFEAFLENYGLELREEIALDDLVESLMAIGEGLALRQIAEPARGRRKARRLRLQAAAAMALLLAVVQDGDERTLAERTDDLVS
jgi:hypothetical protein